MGSEYTKGEWYVKDWHTRIEIRHEQRVIANLDSSDFTLAEDEANANLIAKSPRMYELLRDLVENGWNAGVSEEAEEIIKDG